MSCFWWNDRRIGNRKGFCRIFIAPEGGSRSKVLKPFHSLYKVLCVRLEDQMCPITGAGLTE